MSPLRLGIGGAELIQLFCLLLAPQSLFPPKRGWEVNNSSAGFRKKASGETQDRKSHLGLKGLPLSENISLGFSF